MKKTRILAALLALTLVLGLGACAPRNSGEDGPDPDAEAPGDAAETPETGDGGTGTNAAGDDTAETGTGEVLVTDLIGRELTLTPGSYRRVVCIGAGALRMYCYVGDVTLLCGVEDIDNETLEERPRMFDAVARPYVLAYGETFASLPSCGVGGPNAQAAEAEKILACDPDIVISEYEDTEKEDALQEQLGVPVVTLKAGPGGVFDDAFRDSMTLLGQIFGAEEKAAALVDYIDGQRAEIQRRVAEIPEEEKPGVYICGLGNWGTTNHLMTAEQYLPFTVAGIRNAVTGLEAPGVQPIEEEKFVALGGEMDVMIFDAAAVKNIKPLYAEDPTLFDACAAWETGEVYLQMAYNAYYTNYEIALANTWFAAKVVYPDLFEDVDMTAKLNEITRAFLGMELAEEIFAAPASFGGYGRIDTETFFG